MKGKTRGMKGGCGGEVKGWIELNGSKGRGGKGGLLTSKVVGRRTKDERGERGGNRGKEEERGGKEGKRREKRGKEGKSRKKIGVKRGKEGK